MKVLVTGGGGFLGRHIVKRLLARGDEVSILARARHPEVEYKGVYLFRTDLSHRDEVIAACEGQEVVYHTAAKAGVWGTWEDFFVPNVLGTRNLLDACRNAGVRKFIYTSTPSVVFNGKHLRGVDESQPYGKRFLCAYAETKAIAEKEVLEANRKDGLRTVALRPHLIWGVGDPHLVPRVIQRARQGKLRIVGDGQNRVDLVHVHNAAEAHLLAEAALDTLGRAAGKAYFVTDGSPVLLWDWINGLLEALGIAPVEKKVSLRAAYTAGAAAEILFRLARSRKEPPMTRFVATELAKDHYFNIHAARRDLGYEPVVSPEEGLRELVDHYKEQEAARRARRERLAREAAEAAGEDEEGNESVSTENQPEEKRRNTDS